MHEKIKEIEKRTIYTPKRQIGNIEDKKIG